MVDHRYRESNDAEKELSALLRSVALSAPSSTKFDPVRVWAARRVGLDPKRAAVYWVSKPGNFDVRFRQPGVLRDEPILGLALIPRDGHLAAYLRPARRLVERGLFQTIAICSQWKFDWFGEAAFTREDALVDATIGGLIEQDAILAVGEVEQPDESTETTKDEPPLQGSDTGLSIGWGEYPLDSVFVRTESRTVGEAVKRIKAGRYELDPDFQRDFVWNVRKQSRLIESCLMRIPLPVFYVAEAKDGRIIIVDGLQRLTTFARYLQDEFALSGLDDREREIFHPLSGHRFSDLPLSLQERIEDTQLTLYVLDAKAPERAKLDIFERVNSGVVLSRQQMRNCLYNGPATRWLKSATSEPAFLQATGGSLDPKTMRDREAINRFCAFFQSGWKHYQSGDMDGFLAQALEEMNASPSRERERLMEAFRRTMKTNRMLFGRHAFRKSLASADPNSYRTVINIALFDVCSVLLARAETDRIKANANEIRQAIRDLVETSDFNHAITYSTNSTRQVHARFTLAETAIERSLSC